MQRGCEPFLLDRNSTEQISKYFPDAYQKYPTISWVISLCLSDSVVYRDVVLKYEVVSGENTMENVAIQFVTNDSENNIILVLYLASFKFN